MAARIIGVFIVWSFVATALAAEPPGLLCLAPERVVTVRAAWSGAPGRLAEVAQREGLTEAQLLSALPPELAIGTDGGAHPRRRTLQGEQIFEP